MAELGEATDPRSLIPGSPDAIVENARVLRGRAQATTNTGEGLKRIDTGAWRGPASDAFHDKFSYEPVKWLQASDSLDTGAVVLETYAETLRWAQGQAGEAIQQCEQGQNATAAAKRQHDQAVAQAEAQNQTNAASSNPARVQAAPFNDPGEAIRQSARDTLNRARQQLIEAGDRTAAALHAESAAAPEDRDWLGDFSSDLGEGAWSAVSGFAETVWDILPIRGIWDADGYTDSLLASAAKACASSTKTSSTRFVNAFMISSANRPM
jgi:Putative T7SS secretion signal domain